MANVEARISIKGKHFEILVDLDEALKVKSGSGDIMSAMQAPKIYKDLKKGEEAKHEELEEAFGTQDLYEIAKKIITNGEVQKTQEFRDEQREKVVKQVISLLLKNAVDQNGRPYTEERLRSAIEEAHYSFNNNLAEKQLPAVVHALKTIIPIKIETKKLKLTIPAQFTGQAYGVISEYKESEEWLANGSLEVIVNVPSGLQIEFYDKLNDITHGAVQSEELKE